MEKKQKQRLARILCAAAVFLLLLPLPLEGYWRLTAFLVPYGIAGWEVLWRALRNIFRGQVFDENFLMAVATVGAFCIGEYLEGVAVMLFYQVGELFQDVAVTRSRRSISELMDIRPDYANLQTENGLRRVDPQQVRPGEWVVVKAGEKIPLDGRVLEGDTTLDTAALTGEPLPREVRPGDEVISGCVNLSGVITVEVSKEFGESTVSKILDLVENSAGKKAKAEHFITRFARIYTPVVVICAVLLAIVPPLFLGGWSGWIERGLIFLVISCPCALVISIPMSFFGGIGGASKKGILVKGGNYLEALARTGIVVFDKTGTLTKGSFTVTAVHPDRISREELLELAALAEGFSDHPISRSLKKAYGRRIDEERIANVREIAGRGIESYVDGRRVCAGNGRLMEQEGVAWRECHRAGTVVHVAIDGLYAGHIVISDEIKPDAAQAISALRQGGVRKVVMLTGDAPSAAEQVGKALALDEVQAGLLPGDKVERVESLLCQKTGKETLAFVGDGINDAPVLSRADIGIAMGGMGSDAAIEAADIVLMDDQPSKIAEAVSISRKTLRIVKENIMFAVGVKILVLLLGAAGLANMWAAVFADVGVSVLAILNASRALRCRPSLKTRFETA